MKELFLNIIRNYRQSSLDPFENNPTANFIRGTLKDEVVKIINDPKYLVKGSPGNGNWASCPWVAIFNKAITTSAQDGYYPVFIFRQDMSGFYLTLNQGVTSVGNKYKRGYRNILKEHASYFRAEIGSTPINFNEIIIDLKSDSITKNKLPKDYEAGNIIAKFYDSNNLPSNEIFRNDINQILEIYDSLTLNHEILTLIEEDKEQEKIQQASISPTEKEQLIKARLGQGVFKTKLSKIEKGCRVTGVTEPLFLTASHIKPWCKSENYEKLDGNNGLLLSPHLDRLFDRGWISFSDIGDMLVKNSLVEEIINKWGIPIKNVGKFNTKQQGYLAYHRERFKF